MISIFIMFVFLIILASIVFVVFLTNGKEFVINRIYDFI